MRHIKGMAAITNPLVNSYKRLVPGFEAPVYIAWSTTNRSPLIRIPAAADGEGTRIELRSPDSAANPYLTLAVCLSAGLEGIQEKIEPPPQSINANILPCQKKNVRNCISISCPAHFWRQWRNWRRILSFRKCLEIILPENTSMPSGKSGMSTVLRYPSGRFRSICTSIKIFLSFVIME